MEGMPQPNENHKKLQRLTGSWTGDEKLYPSPWGPGGQAKGKMTTRLDIDGFFLIQDYVQEKDGRTCYRGHGIVGWDEKKKRYAWYWVDSMGMVPHAPASGAFEGDTLTFEQETPGMGFSRFTYKMAGEGKLAFSIEHSKDGKAWQTFMEADYHRA